MARFTSMGTVLKVTIVATPTAIPQMISVPFVGIRREFEDVTALDSAGNFKEYAQTLNDTAEWEGELWWDASNSVHDYLMDQAMLAVALTDVFEISTPQVTGAPTQAFSGIISEFTPNTVVNGNIKARLRIRVTGQPVYTQ